MYSHETEIIFALPALYMNLKSTHFQGKYEPQQDGKLECVCHLHTYYVHVQMLKNLKPVHLACMQNTTGWQVVCVCLHVCVCESMPEPLHALSAHFQASTV